MSRTLIEDVAELSRRLAPHLRGSIKAIVFGSAARGKADEWSDLDLVVVADTPRPFFERFKDFTGLSDVWPRLDLLVYPPEEFQRMLEEQNPFLERVMAEGVIVHESPAH